MTQMEALLVEYYDWLGYFVKHNVFVRRLPRGGYGMELDVVAYHPQNGNIFHIEGSLDAQKWTIREERFRRKFEAGRKYILPEIFRWLPQDTPILQRAIFPSCGGGHRNLAGAKVTRLTR